MRNATLAALTVALALIGFSEDGSAACSVLLLGDGDAESQVQPALAAAGHDVVFGGIYYEWDGESPDAADFDVVIFLDGEGYGYGFETHPAAEAALVDFVGEGGALIVTEWTMYDCDGDVFGDAFDALLPVVYSDYDYEDTWTVQAPGHPIAVGLPPTWFDEAGYSIVSPVADATVVIAGAGGNPLLTYRSVDGGVVLHVNHDLTYTTPTINPFSLQALTNSVDFLCSIVPAEATSWSSVKSRY